MVETALTDSRTPAVQRFMKSLTYQAGAMNWPGLSVALSDMPAVMRAKEEILRERAAQSLKPK
jgi:hypothetical protein